LSLTRPGTVLSANAGFAESVLPPRSRLIGPNPGIGTDRRPCLRGGCFILKYRLPELVNLREY